MTTIVYRDGVLAGDTQVSEGSYPVGFQTKVKRFRGLLYGSSGSDGLTVAFERWLRAGMHGEPPPLKGANATADFYIFPGGDLCVWFHADGVTAIRAPWFAFGCGSSFAKGALVMGAGAVEAVKAACALDPWTGGEVTSVSHEAGA